MSEDRAGRGRPPRRGGGGDDARRRDRGAGPRGGGRGDRSSGQGSDARRGGQSRRGQERPRTQDRARPQDRARAEGQGRGGLVPRGGRLPEPAIAEGVTGHELDRAVRAQLRTLSKENAEGVAQHLVMVGLLLAEDDLDGALAHAETAVRRAGRVAAAREALGLVAYRRGEWGRALAEFRTVRRLSGSSHLLPHMVDAERGLGRLERALDLATSPEAGTLAEGDRVELAIVVSGIRRDLGQADAAVAALRLPQLRPESRKPWAAALFYAYAEALLAVDEQEEAREWFARAAEVDEDGRTDADERLAELDGVVVTDLLEGQGQDDGQPGS